MKKITWLLLIFSLAATTSAELSKVGSCGAQFLKIGVGSRYQAMGEASVAVANDVYSMYWNPAGLADIEDWSFGFTRVNWFMDIDVDYVGIAHYFDDVGVVGVSVSVLSMDDQEITTFEQQTGTGDFYSASSYCVGLSYARQLTNRFAFGGSLKYVGERIHNENASTYAFDFGTLLYTGYRSLRMGMSISNMGPELQFSGSDLDISYDEREGEGNNNPIGAQVKTTSYDMPMMFRVGMAYDMEMGANAMMTISGELKHPSDMQQQGALGTELVFSDKYFLRAGYKFRYDEEGLTIGGGLSTQMSNSTTMIIDYAWQDFGRLESTQRFSIGFAF